MTKYAPGSFSKNFAWHGTGLLKLHTAIRDGFSNTLVSVSRDTFRQRCGVEDESLQLIPLNFFLHNHVERSTNVVSVDQLVYSAIEQSHSQLFDRLALFALHLNRAGSRRGRNGESQPALWIKDFVANRLWRDGSWRPEALGDQEMDEFIAQSLIAQPEVRVKCRTNYRHMLDLCGYLRFASDAIDSGAEQWIVPAIFLAWDRLCLDGDIKLPAPKEVLVERLIELAVHKLAGTTEEFVHECALAVAGDYLHAEGVARFDGPAKGQQQRPTVGQPIANYAAAKPKKGAPADEGVMSRDGLELDYSVAEEVKRRLRAVEAQVRNAGHVRKLKRLYGDLCQFCRVPVQVETSPDRFYSEGAHIKPVGKPHNGPDTPANLLILCPNHHVELDTGMLTLVKHAANFVIEARNPDHALHGKQLQLDERHVLDDGLVRWHRDFFAGRRQ